MPKCRIESLGVSFPRRQYFRTGSLYHAVFAGRHCLKKSKHLSKDIQILINSGIHRDQHYAEPAFAAFIQKKLGINTEFQGRKTLSFDLQNSGCGMLSAAYVLDTMLKNGSIHTGMVVSSEANSDKHPDENYKIPESGAAFIMDISPVSSVGFGNFVFRTYEQYQDLYGTVVSLSKKYGQLIVRKKAKLENAYLECVKPVISELLQKEDLDINDIDFVIPSQISDQFLLRLSEELSFSKEQIINTGHLFSDTLTTSVFLGLQYLIDSKKVDKGKKILLLTCGAGITIGAVVYYF